MKSVDVWTQNLDQHKVKAVENFMGHEYFCKAQCEIYIYNYFSSTLLYIASYLQYAFSIKGFKEITSFHWNMRHDKLLWIRTSSSYLLFTLVPHKTFQKDKKIRFLNFLPLTHACMQKTYHCGLWQMGFLQSQFHSYRSDCTAVNSPGPTPPPEIKFRQTVL